MRASDHPLARVGDRRVEPVAVVDRRRARAAAVSSSGSTTWSSMGVDGRDALGVRLVQQVERPLPSVGALVGRHRIVRRG